MHGDADQSFLHQKVDNSIDIRTMHYTTTRLCVSMGKD